MKAQRLIKQWLSSPAHRLVYVSLVVVLGLGVFWWAINGQPVKAQGNLVLSKDNGVDTVVPGQTLVYQIVITNTDNESATGIRLTDILPAHTAFVLASDGGQETFSGSGIVTWPDFDLSGDSNAIRLLVITVNDPFPVSVTAITNTVSLRDGVGHTVVATDTDSVETDPIFTLVKTSAITTTSPSETFSETFSYTITLTNHSATEATNVLITDTLPTGVTFVAANLDGAETFSGSGIVTWSVSTVLSNTGVTRLLTVTVNPTLPAGIELLVNTIQATDDAGNTAIAQYANIVDAAPDLVLNKSDGNITVKPGDVLTYTLFYTNAGTQGATGVDIAETVPAHTTFYTPTSNPGWSCPHGAPAGTHCAYTIGDLAAEDSGSITFAVRVASPLPAGVEEIENTASIADDGANGEDLNPGDNTYTMTTLIEAAPYLEISKSNSQSTVQPGATLAYLITITNTGNQNAVGILLTDTLFLYTSFLVASDGGAETPPGSRVVTWPAFNLPGNNRSVTRLVVATVGETLPAGIDSITNTASIVAPGQTELTETQHIDSVIAAPNLTLSKSDGDVNAIPGATLVYTLTYANVGNQGATGVVITETVPEHTTFAGPAAWSCNVGDPAGTTCTYNVSNLAANVSDYVTFTVNVITPISANVTHIDNTATIADDGSNSADVISRTATLATPVSAAPDLEISKSSSADSVEPGDTLTYQIVVTNTGNQGATGVRITDYLPAHTAFASASDGGALSATGVVTWPLFDLPGGGASVIRTLNVTVTNPFPVDTNVITNTATVADDGANGPDPTPGNNTSILTTTINAAPNLVLSKHSDVLTVTPGSTLIYQLVITNTGNQLAGGIVLTDTLPEYTAFTLASHDGVVNSGIVAWPAFSLPGGGASTTRLLVVSVDNPLPAGVTALTNTAALRDNRGYTATTQYTNAVNANPEFILVKTSAITTATPGAEFSLSLIHI